MPRGATVDEGILAAGIGKFRWVRVPSWTLVVCGNSLVLRRGLDFHRLPLIQAR